MFPGPGPGRTRPPMPPFPFGPGPNSPGRPPFGGPQGAGRPNLISMFQNENGQLDFNKIMGTANEIGKVYNQVRPMISKFMK